MARGFASKSVADQQEEAASSVRRKDPESNANEEKAALLSRRRKLELSRKDVERRLESAQAEAHREMLRRALAALDEEIASLN
jgi:NACalpha-BTF3-like transcription factor